MKHTIASLIERDGRWLGGVCPKDVAWATWDTAGPWESEQIVVYDADTGKVLAASGEGPFDTSGVDGEEEYLAEMQWLPDGTVRMRRLEE